MARPKIPSMTVKRVWQEAASCCAFCNEAEVTTLEIHHIDEDPTNNDLVNLLLVCSGCHSKITHGVISKADAMLQKRIMQFQAKGNAAVGDVPTNSLNVEKTVNTGIIANVVNMKGPKKPKMNYPPDAIGADTIKKSYIDYLYGQYFECRKADGRFGAHAHAQKFHPSELHRTIQSHFKAKTFFIHVNRFLELVAFMQGRIDRTILGRNNRSNGVSNYIDFETFRREQLGE